MPKLRPLMAFLLLAGCAEPAATGAAPPGPQAGTRVMRRATTMGTGVQVASFARWNERCEASGLPDARVVLEPPHGTLVARPALVTAGNRVFSGGTNCRDKQINGVEMWYTPDPGFRGTDPMSFEITNGGEPVRMSATVDVR